MSYTVKLCAMVARISWDEKFDDDTADAMKDAAGAALREHDSLRAQLQQANDKIADLERVREAAEAWRENEESSRALMDLRQSLDDYKEKWGKAKEQG